MCQDKSRETKEHPACIKVVSKQDENDCSVGETAETTNDHKMKMIEEMAKTRNVDKVLIKSLMELTYNVRRKEITTNPKPIKDVLAEWPALQLTSEVS